MTRDDKEIVSALRAIVADMVGKDLFALCMGTNVDWSFHDGRFCLTAPDPFTLERIRSRHLSKLQSAVRKLSEQNPAVAVEADIQLVVDQANRAEKKAATQPLPAALPEPKETSQRQRAKLQDFLIGDTNRVARSAVDSLFSQPLFSVPIYIYGPPGTGKSHLMDGIVGQAMRSGWRRVVSLSAEQFTSQFLGALRGSGLPNFRRKYRDARLLLIEDIHFFVGKRATLVEFQHTLDTISRAGHRVVMTADQSPSDLRALGPEITARLTGGLVCRIELPDTELRRGILKQFAKKLGMRLPGDVVEFLSQRLPGDVRQLQGALHRLQAARDAFRKPINMDLVKSHLADLLQIQRVVRLPDIERAVCNLFGLEREILQSDCKTKAVSHPRMLAMWLAREHTRAAYAEIGDYFGQRTHSTVISAHHKVNRWIDENGTIQVPHGCYPVADAVRRVQSILGATGS